MENRKVQRSSVNIKPSRSLIVEVGSLTTFMLSLFFVAALFTYRPSDPSWFASQSLGGGPALNACGRGGAFFSALFFQTFGLGAFLIPVATFFTGVILLKREGTYKFLRSASGMVVSVLAATVFLSLQWKYWPYSGALLLTGGVLGSWISETLLSQFNHLGASILALLCFGVALVFSTPLSVVQFGSLVLSTLFRVTWRVLKVSSAYLLYLLSFLLMKCAHATGDFLQRQIEWAVQRARAYQLKKATLIGTLESEECDLNSPFPSANTTLFLDEDRSPAGADKGVGDTSGYTSESVEQVLAINSSENFSESSCPTKLGSSPISASPDKITIIPPSPKDSIEGGDSVAIQIATKVAGKLSRLKKKGHWKLPTLELLRKPPKVESHIDRDKIYENAVILVQKLADFGITGEVLQVMPGPVITLYEFKPGPGVKVSKIASLADDLSMALSARSVRILAPLPGKAVVGIEIPSEVRETVYMRELTQHPDFSSSKNLIPVAMGKDISGHVMVADLAKMPHLLVAGQTGSGKSVFMNSLICSLFYRFTPDELRMILIDPKYIEFRSYQDIPHLLLPVVDDPKQAATALKWAVREMERRYRILAKVGAKNLASYNLKVDESGVEAIEAILLAEESLDEGHGPTQAISGGDWIEAFEPDESGAHRIGKLPYIVIIIDELADLMMIAKKEVEISIARIAQKARAAGIHLIVATQRPSTDVITGLIKANLPSRASFQLAAYVDSNTILGRGGAERLLGQGDMLFIAPGTSELTRLHGAYLSDEEIDQVTAFLRDQGKPLYRNEILISDEEDEEDLEGDDRDDLWDQAIDLVKKNGHASASFLQRHLKVGYNRAARMIEDMEVQGIVGPADGARPREVLMR